MKHRVDAAAQLNGSGDVIVHHAARCFARVRTARHKDGMFRFEAVRIKPSPQILRSERNFRVNAKRRLANEHAARKLDRFIRVISRIVIFLFIRLSPFFSQ